MQWDHVDLACLTADLLDRSHLRSTAFEWSDMHLMRPIQLRWLVRFYLVVAIAFRSAMRWCQKDGASTKFAVGYVSLPIRLQGSCDPEALGWWNI